MDGGTEGSETEEKGGEEDNYMSKNNKEAVERGRARREEGDKEKKR